MVLCYLNHNKTLRVEFIQSHQERKYEWNIKFISNSINLQEIINNPEIKWNYNWISENPTLTSEFVLTHFKENWDWIVVFSNLNINYDILAESKIDLSKQIKHVFATRANTIPLAKNLTANFIKRY